MKDYKNDFVTKNDFVYLNSASTSYILKSSFVTMNSYYEHLGANYGRGIDSLGYQVTLEVEKTRENISKFLGCDTEEVIFTRGTTESVNLVAYSLGDLVIKEGDEIIVSIAEHHSNFVPWMELAKRKKARFITIGLDDNKRLNLEELKEKISPKTKIVAINHSSNVLGSINDIKTIADIVHSNNSYLLVDGAQGILHENIDLEQLDIDFYCFSSHKIYGPKGVGILFGKKELLDKMNPMIFGGEMVDVVTSSTSSYKKAPYKFEAGTMMIPEIIGFNKSIEYFNRIGSVTINKHIKELRDYTLKKMQEEMDNLIIYNDLENSTNIISFNIKGIHAHDVAGVLDKNKIIVRAGHHCAEPLMNYLNTEATVRVSFGLYNSLEDCDLFIEALKKAEDYIDVLF